MTDTVYVKSSCAKQELQFAAIKAAPVYSLAECIAAEEEGGLEEALDDDEESDDPAEEIKEKFRAVLYHCDEPELAFLRSAAEMTEKKQAWTENVSYHPFRLFAFDGFIYLFLWEEQHYLVMPDELREILWEVRSETSFSERNARNLEMAQYEAALHNLYGAYEIEWFATVWNHHHKDKITPEEAEEFLIDRESFYCDFYIDGRYVVCEWVSENELEHLLEAVKGLAYYMPTKKVIQEYAKKGYDDYTICGESEMEEYLAGYIADTLILDDLQFNVTKSCERLYGPEAVRELLEDAGAPLEDEAFCERFELLYNRLRDNTHIWELRGCTPYQFQLETHKVLKRFVLPKGKKKKARGGKVDH